MSPALSSHARAHLGTQESYDHGISSEEQIAKSGDIVLCIACSGVENDVLERCRRAVQNLGKARLLETEEECFSIGVTHLVIGNETRSSKLLHAIACGAKIVTPSWLVQCIRWRGWISCDNYLSKVWQIDYP